MFLEESIDETKRFPRWLLPAAVFFVIIIFFAISILIFENKFANKIYPGIYVGNLNIGGMDPLDAEKIISAEAESYSDGIKFDYENKVVVIEVMTFSFDGGGGQMIVIKPEETARKAFDFGRDGNPLINFKNKISALIFKKSLSANFDIDEEKISRALHENYLGSESLAADANLNFIWSVSGESIINISSERVGKVIDYDKAIAELKAQLANLDNSKINILSRTEYPKLTKSECLDVEQNARELLSSAPITLKHGENKWLIDAKKLSELLKLTKADRKVKIVLDPEKFKEFMDKDLAKTITKEPIQAKFEMKNGRVTEFQGGQVGISIDYDRTLSMINDNLFTNTQSNGSKKEIEIITSEYANSVETDQVNNYGIKEIIGTGHSSFAGSPSNRRHNIKTGAMAINGTLIAPGQEFSTIKILGEITAKSGYLPEMVIKGNKTIPEYGGGLCQVGTTLFRAATSSGLPITARRNHSYRVSYYEPAGTDATIYDPNPDFKFLNDTPNYVLLQSRIEGDDLYFDVWGAKDGRVVEKTEPKIYNITKPGPAKIIETTDLSPGVKKCTEKAHNGADAYFDYKVIYPLETGSSTPLVKQTRFTSHYIPWREVCLVGVEKQTETTAEQTASSTPQTQSQTLN